MTPCGFLLPQVSYSLILEFRFGAKVLTEPYKAALNLSKGNLSNWVERNRQGNVHQAKQKDMVQPGNKQYTL